MVDDVLEEGEVGGDAADAELAERPVHAGDGLLGGRRPGGDLLEERIVVAGDHRAGIGGAAVEADAEAGRAAIGGDAAVVGDEVLLRVLGGDPALERVAVEADIALARHARGRVADLGAAGDPDLRLDDVDAGHLLGDGVLDLDARIDLDEIELAGVGIHQELDGAGPGIVRGVGDGDGVRGKLLRAARRRDRGRARARRPSGGGAAPCSRARRGGRSSRACRRGSAPRHGGRARPASRDRPRRGRRRPWPRAAPRRCRGGGPLRRGSRACRGRRRPTTP